MEVYKDMKNDASDTSNAFDVSDIPNAIIKIKGLKNKVRSWKG